MPNAPAKSLRTYDDIDLKWLMLYVEKIRDKAIEKDEDPDLIFPIFTDTIRNDPKLLDEFMLSIPSDSWKRMKVAFRAREKAAENRVIDAAVERGIWNIPNDKAKEILKHWFYEGGHDDWKLFAFLAPKQYHAILFAMAKKYEGQSPWAVITKCLTGGAE